MRGYNGRSTKDEMEDEDYLSLDTALPDNLNRRGGKQFNRGRGCNRRGGRGRGKITEKDEIRNKFIRLGDAPDRLVMATRDIVRLVDASLRREVQSWELPPFRDALDVDEPLVLLKQGVLSIRPAVAPESPSASVIKLFVDCVLSLPHKHSYFATLWWLLLSEGAPQGCTIPMIIRKAYSSITKAEGIVVKAEVTEDGQPPVTVLPTDGEGVRKADLDPASALPVDSLSKEDCKDTLRYIYLFQAFIDDLSQSMERIITSEYGVDDSTSLENGIRFWSDLVNLELVKFESYMGYSARLLEEGAISSSKGLRSCSGYQLGLSMNMCLWLGRDIFRRHSDVFGLYLCRVQEIVDGCRMQGDLSSEIEQLIAGLKSADARGWTSKVMPRLYESPKLTIERRKPFAMALDFELSALVTAAIWSETGFTRNSELRAPVLPQVVIYKPPPNLLYWNHQYFMDSKLKIFPDALLKNLIDVEPLSPMDVCITQKYIWNSLAMFYTDPDLCAETLLYIPIAHDHFIYILIESIFSICLNNLPLPILGTRVYSRMTAIFMAQIFRRLLVLERRLLGIINQALKSLITQISDWSEHEFQVLVLFVATWVASDNSYSGSFFETICNGENYAVNSPERRFLRHMIQKLSGLTSADTLQWKLPEKLYSYVLPRNLEVQKIPFVVQGNVPNEFTLLNRLMRLQVTGEHEVYVLTEELFSFLQSRLGRKLISDLGNLTQEEVDNILFPPVASSGMLKRDATKLESDGDELQPPTKRGRQSEETATKLEIDCQEQEFKAAAQEQPMDIIENMIKDEDLAALPAPRTDKFSTMEYAYNDTETFVWDIKSLTSLLIHSVLNLGSKTLSHSQKSLDVYARLLMKWKYSLENYSDVVDWEELILERIFRSALPVSIERWGRHFVHHLFMQVQMDPATIFELRHSGPDQELWETDAIQNQ